MCVSYKQKETDVRRKVERKKNIPTAETDTNEEEEEEEEEEVQDIHKIEGRYKERDVAHKSETHTQRGNRSKVGACTLIADMTTAELACAKRGVTRSMMPSASDGDGENWCAGGDGRRRHR